MQEINAFMSDDGRLWKTKEEALQADKNSLSKRLHDHIHGLAHIEYNEIHNLYEVLAATVSFIQHEGICKNKASVKEFVELLMEKHDKYEEYEECE